MHSMSHHLDIWKANDRASPNINKDQYLNDILNVSIKYIFYDLSVNQPTGAAILWISIQKLYVLIFVNEKI